MAKLKFVGTWSGQMQNQFNIPKGSGYMLLQSKSFYTDKVGQFEGTLHKHQMKALGESSGSDYLKELDVTIEVHYKKRTLDMNNLMWALYAVEANEQNAGMSGDDEQMVHPQELYTADLLEHGERETVKTMADNLPYYNSEYHVLGINWKGKVIAVSELSNHIIQPDEEIEILYIRGTSKLNTVQMAKWIDRQFNRLAYNGVVFETASEIADYWVKFQQHKNDEKITYSETIISKSEYRELHPICEACGVHLTEGGQLAHIKAVGMGADRKAEPDKNYSSNWLHLCHKCHIEIQHQKGWSEFIKLFPHLTYKVETAQCREYKPITDNQLEIF